MPDAIRRRNVRTSGSNAHAQRLDFLGDDIFIKFRFLKVFGSYFYVSHTKPIQYKTGCQLMVA